jgi:hypothetical protein
MERTDLTTILVFHDGERKAKFEGKDAPEKALGFLHKNCGMSASWAIKHEGWLVQEFHEKGNFYWAEKNYGI